MYKLGLWEQHSHMIACFACVSVVRAQSPSTTFGDGMAFNSEEAIKRATDSLKRQDYLVAARSCMASLEKDVRNSVALQVQVMPAGAPGGGGGGFNIFTLCSCGDKSHHAHASSEENECRIPTG